MTKKIVPAQSPKRTTTKETIVRKDSGASRNSESSSHISNKKSITETRTTGSTGPKEKK